MRVCWRDISSQRNSMAALYAACERSGIDLHIVPEPSLDVTLYSLNSITGRNYYEEISNAEVVTVIGGPHATARWKELVSIADYVVIGEGEYTVPRLLRCIESGASVPPGVATSDGYQPVDHTVFLDGNPGFSKYRGYIEISRGCPYKCAYCQTPRLFGHQMRHRSIGSIISMAKTYSQIRLLSPNTLAYGTDGVHPDIRYVKRLLEELSKLPGREIYLGTFPGEVRPEFVDEEAVNLIFRYCANKKIHLGAQSGSDSVLYRISRSHTLSDIHTAVDKIVEGGLKPVIDIIVGFPDETDEEMMDTVQLCSEVCRVGYVHAHRFISLPGTPLEGQRSRDLIPEAESALGSLALSGKLTGSWNRSEIRFFSKIPKL